MKREILSSALVMAAAIPASQAGAQEFLGGELSGELTLVSQYMYRGISQTSGDPALQGDLSWTHASGVYVGVWGSNTDAGGDGNWLETGPYFGFAAPLGETGFDIDLGLAFFLYPGAEASLDYWEAYAALSYGFQDVTVTGRLGYSDDYFGDDFFPGVSSVSFDGTAEWALPNDFSVSGTLGRQWFDDQPGLPSQDFTYYDIGVSKAWRAFTFDLRWHDADGVRPNLAAPGDVGALVAGVSVGF